MKGKRTPSRREVAGWIGHYAALSGRPNPLAPEVLRPAAKPAETITPRPKAVRALGALEAQVLSAVLRYLRADPRVGWCHRMNVGAYEDAATGRYLAYGFRGLSDVIGQLRDGRFLAVECKREKGGVVSDAQREFLDLVRRHGGVAGVVRSVDEAAALIADACEGEP